VPCLNLFVPKGIRREIRAGQSYCSMCDKYKPMKEFNLRSGGRPDGRCKLCCRVYHKMKRYGLTEDQCRELSTPPVCTICGSYGSDSKHGLVVDHSHETNVVRGLLCIGCNVLVAWIEARRKPDLNDSVEYLANNRNIVPAAPIGSSFDTRLHASVTYRRGSTYELTDPAGCTYTTASLKHFCSERGFILCTFQASVKANRDKILWGRAAGWSIRKLLDGGAVVEATS
jgi:hypothetical protein